MKKFLNISLLICLLIPGILISECNFQNAIFSINKSDYDFLNYTFYRNAFDSAEVNYQFGEILVGSGANFQRIYLVNKYFQDTKFGATAQGLDTVLLTFGDSEPFIVGQNHIVKYFGQLSAFVKCGSGGITVIGTQTGGTNNWRDKYWMVGANHISDRTEFVVQLIDSANNPISTLDSVGVAPNPNTDLALRYGTEPDKMNHVKVLSSSLVGKRVFVRVSPRRWGQTPYGIDSKISKSWISLSTIFEYDSISINKCTEAVYDTLHNLMFSKMIDYEDSVFNSTGILPLETNGLPLSETQYSYWKNRYFEPYITSNGDTLYVGKGGFHHPRIAEGSFEEKISNSIDDMILSNVLIKPNPTNKRNITLTFKSQNKIDNIFVNIYSYNGALLSKVWQGNIIKGKNEIALNLPPIYKGNYLIALSKSDKFIGYKKLIVED